MKIKMLLFMLFAIFALPLSGLADVDAKVTLEAPFKYPAVDAPESKDTAWFKYLDEKKMIEWRHWLHQHPELSFQEKQTSEFVVNELKKFGNIEILRPTETGVVGVLKGGKPGPVVALRADMDALPLDEEADVPFKSQTKGVFHACGHDVHTAMLLGAAGALSKMQGELHGTVKFIFQPAEEAGRVDSNGKTVSGATELVRSGVLNDVNMFMGEHVVPFIPTNMVASRRGAVTASYDDYDITITGVGSHGSTPHLSVDPVMIGANIVVELNQIISRNISAQDQAVISTCIFQAGTAPNIIPQTARIAGSVRSFTPEVRALIEKRIRAIVDGLCAAHGASYKLDYIPGQDSVVNDDGCLGLARDAAEKYLGEGSFIELPFGMASEDFFEYQSIAPVVFVIVGAGTAEEGFGVMNHNPGFKASDQSLMTGAKLYVGFVLEALNKK